VVLSTIDLLLFNRAASLTARGKRFRTQHSTSNKPLTDSVTHNLLLDSFPPASLIQINVRGKRAVRHKAELENRIERAKMKTAGIVSRALLAIFFLLVEIEPSGAWTVIAGFGAASDKKGEHHDPSSGQPSSAFQI